MIISRDTEILNGNKCQVLLQELIDNRTIVSLYALGTTFEHLTVIIGMEQTAAGGFLIVDTPAGFKAAVAGTEPWRLRFNCNGPDRLEYLFSTTGGTYCDQGLRIPIPDGVQRLQRRKDFRINCLPNTRLQFNVRKLVGIMLLHNISMGGVFGDLIKHNSENARVPLLKVSQLLSKLMITFPGYAETHDQLVTIKRARVVRIQRNRETHIDQYALQFMEIDRFQEPILRSAIYRLQRYYLQNR